MNILFTICGRAGSKGFKNKNLKVMNRVPLIFFTLAAIRLYQEKHLENRVAAALNTDSDELADLVSRQSIFPFVSLVDRKDELAGDTVAKVDVIKDTYLTMKQKMSIDVVVDLDITSPMRRLCDVENVLKEYCANEDYDLVYSVVKSRRSPYFNMVEKKNNSYYGKICQSDFTARQQAESTYELNASIYAYRPAFLDSEIQKTILEYRCGIAVMPDYLVLDIDSEEDFKMMEYLHNYYCRHDDGLKVIHDRALEEVRGDSPDEI